MAYYSCMDGLHVVCPYFQAGYSGFQATGMIEWGQKMFRAEQKRRGVNLLCEGCGLLSSKPPEKYDVLFLADLKN